MTPPRDYTKKTRKSDPFWYSDPKILVEADRLTDFFPSPDMTPLEQLNAIVRFCVYLSLLLTILKNNAQYLFLAIASFVVTYLVYAYDPNMRLHKKFERVETYDIYQNRKKERAEVNYVRPTIDNPFMNPTLVDIKENPNRDSYSRKSFINNAEIEKDIEDKFNYNLYQDVNDVYGRKNSQRQYYTVPSTTIPNDRDTFAKWLYGNPASCKEGNGKQCEQNMRRNLDGESRMIIY